MAAKPFKLGMGGTQIDGLGHLGIDGRYYNGNQVADFAQTTPAVGAQVSTPVGEGTVVAHQVPADAVLVRVKGAGVQVCAKADVCPSRNAYDSRTPKPGAEPTP